MFLSTIQNIRIHGQWTFKGPQCEVRVLIDLMIRALVNGYHSFHLINNKNEAGKCDDILFLYRISETEPERLRLIQSKNTHGSLVTVKDLLETPEGNFDLKKYLNSYNEIRNNPMFTGYEIEDCCLVYHLRHRQRFFFRVLWYNTDSCCLGK